jgi:hypothetical protein
MEPLMFTAHVTSAHWFGVEMIPNPSQGLVHPASNTARLGQLTGTILNYVEGQTLHVQMPGGGRLDVLLSQGTWQYTGTEGFAHGTIQRG